MKKLIFITLALVVVIVQIPALRGESKANASKSTQSYPVVLPTMSLLGLTGHCDGTLDSRRTVLANLWKNFGETNIFNGEKGLYRRKIFVVYYNHTPEGGYSIFIGYTIINWLRSEITLGGNSLVVLDFPKGNYLAYDSPSSSTNGVIKSWENFYSMYPNDVRNRALEVYDLDADSYTVENVTLYLKVK